MGQAGVLRKMRVEWDWARLWAHELRRLILWFPVGLGVGIWIYFALPFEPDPVWACVALAPILLVPFCAEGRFRIVRLFLTGVVASVAIGFSAAVLHANWLISPVLPHPVDETVEGRVIDLSLSQSGSVRVLLDRVRIYGVDPRQTPDRVRVTLRSEDLAPAPGHRIRVYARLSPPSGPVEPGGFDFRRRAFFERLGAVGFARGIAVPLGLGDLRGTFDAAMVWLTTTRQHVSGHLQAQLPGSSGAVAAAIVVGDRTAIDEADAEALRVSSLAHLLAISGLHMGMLTGLVFAGCRILLATVPPLALRISTKKLAAVAALFAGLAYLAFSGGTVATQRAFIMVAVALVAVLLDRPAISLRALAVAACIVLLIRPVSLLDVGFQMSFAATTALVAGYATLREWTRREMTDERRPKRSLTYRLGRTVAVYTGGLVMTSILAGLATAPYSAFYFNRMAPYGLPANLAAVPAMGILVAPSAMLSGALAPFGLEVYGLRLMGAGIDWILEVAHWITALPGAIRPVPAAAGWVLGAISLGGLVLALCSGPWRVAGILPLAFGVLLWADPRGRPEVLISDDARLTGVLRPEGRVVDQARAAGFIAERWLARDGDLVTQETAFEREGLRREKGYTEARLDNGWTVVVMRGSGDDPAAFCRSRTLILLSGNEQPAGECRAITSSERRRLGSLAIRTLGDGIDIQPANTGRRRLWISR